MYNNSFSKKSRRTQQVRIIKHLKSLMYDTILLTEKLNPPTMA